jgi:hypothetical protein
MEDGCWLSKLVWEARRGVGWAEKLKGGKSGRNGRALCPCRARHCLFLCGAGHHRHHGRHRCLPAARRQGLQVRPPGPGEGCHAQPRLHGAACFCSSGVGGQRPGRPSAELSGARAAPFRAPLSQRAGAPPAGRQRRGAAAAARPDPVHQQQGLQVGRQRGRMGGDTEPGEGVAFAAPRRPEVV